MLLEIVKIYCGAVLAVIPAAFVFAFLEIHYLRKRENKSVQSSIVFPYGMTRYICVNDLLSTGMLYAILWPIFCYDIGCIVGETIHKWLNRTQIICKYNRYEKRPKVRKNI